MITSRVREGRGSLPTFYLIVLQVHMASVYNIMLVISHHVLLLSDAVHLLSIFTINVMLSWMKEKLRQWIPTLKLN